MARNGRGVANMSIWFAAGKKEALVLDSFRDKGPMTCTV